MGELTLARAPSPACQFDRAPRAVIVTAHYIPNTPKRVTKTGRSTCRNRSSSAVAAVALLRAGRDAARNKDNAAKADEERFLHDDLPVFVTRFGVFGMWCAVTMTARGARSN